MSLPSHLAHLSLPPTPFPSPQTNETNDEIPNTLKYVRPGKGFEPKMDLFAKVNVNGAGAHPVFAFLRRTLKYPEDDEGVKDSKKNGVPDTEYLVSSRSVFDTTTVVTWSPVSRTDISWNFEKFICDQDGKPVKRYSRYYPTLEIAADLERLLKHGHL
jgi:glutathione peroxidase